VDLQGMPWLCGKDLVIWIDLGKDDPWILDSPLSPIGFLVFALDLTLSSLTL